jgi:glutaredoxin-related protein
MSKMDNFFATITHTNEGNNETINIQTIKNILTNTATLETQPPAITVIHELVENSNKYDEIETITTTLIKNFIELCDTILDLEIDIHLQIKINEDTYRKLKTQTRPEILLVAYLGRIRVEYEKVLNATHKERLTMAKNMICAIQAKEKVYRYSLENGTMTKK